MIWMCLREMRSICAFNKTPFSNRKSTLSIHIHSAICVYWFQYLFLNAFYFSFVFIKLWPSRVFRLIFLTHQTFHWNAYIPFIYDKSLTGFYFQRIQNKARVLQVVLGDFVAHRSQKKNISKSFLLKFKQNVTKINTTIDTKFRIQRGEFYRCILIYSMAVSK